MQIKELVPYVRRSWDLKMKSRLVKKGADGINNASAERGDTIIVMAGTRVHKSCRLNYINKKEIERHKRTKSDVLPAKRTSRRSTGSFERKTDCLFCGNDIVTSKRSADYDDFSCVRTETFVEKILAQCKTRSDEWAVTIQGRIEYFSGDLHAADSLYHHSCDVHFRTDRSVPMHHRHDGDGPSGKRQKAGRPKDSNQEQAFLRMCCFFEENDEEQLTVTDLANKLKQYLQGSDSAPYSISSPNF